ncbi:MAG: aldehyde dehydrogenase family protein [Gemmobacter sp.]
MAQKGPHDAVVSELERQILALRVERALEEASRIGPVASKSQLDLNLCYIALARREGCEGPGGERAAGETYGYFQCPAPFLGASNAMRSSREEIFGVIRNE